MYTNSVTKTINSLFLKINMSIHDVPSYCPIMNFETRWGGIQSYQVPNVISLIFIILQVCCWCMSSVIGQPQFCFLNLHKYDILWFKPNYQEPYRGSMCICIIEYAVHKLNMWMSNVDDRCESYVLCIYSKYCFTFCVFTINNVLIFT